ncbi:DUF4136 domain-containing protein [Sphingomonas hankyongi]|uniref:DUF4136 domain-containing protein n=1 Tax=Sphingomonas hankyongi TaxID=2908209 RepID=A0ABT0S3Y4_9SPHN|nr:DUF4136 domain-containing protein [Sphingomonas hankyongi]MCL6730590.1 DUF4136 domain-containing protein [Sphingomonas hankyongi]
MRVFPLAAALLLSACAYGPTIRTDFDPAANYASYRTYSWIPVDVPRGMNPLMFRRVQASIDRELNTRGFTQANPGDFAIAFTIGEQDRTEVQSYGGYGGWGGWGWGSGWHGWGGWGGGWGWGPGWGGWGYPYIDSYQVTERSLVIDIYDAKTRQPVWHGVAQKDSYSDEIDYSKLDATVSAVLAGFPPPPGAQPRGWASR